MKHSRSKTSKEPWRPSCGPPSDTSADAASKPPRKRSPPSITTIHEGDRSLPELIDLVRDAALDLKAEDVLILPLEGRTIVADAFVIATGRSKIQTRSIADAIVDAAREAGFPVARTEGYSDGGWILIDLGPIVAHVFTPEQRAFYNLERLWGAPDAQQARTS